MAQPKATQKFIHPVVTVYRPPPPGPDRPAAGKNVPAPPASSYYSTMPSKAKSPPGGGPGVNPVPQQAPQVTE